MSRTEEQIAADDNLTAAIERVAKLSGVLTDGDMLGDFVVVAATQTMDSDGEIEHAHISLFRNSGIAGWAAVGLLETASFFIKAGGELTRSGRDGATSTISISWSILTAHPATTICPSASSRPRRSQRTSSGW